MSRIIGRTLRIRQIFLKELRQSINQRRNLGLAANVGEFGERDAFITEGLPSRDVPVEEFAAYVVKTQTDNVGIAFPATLQGGAYGFGKVGRLDQSMIVVPSFRTLPDGKLLQSPKEAKYIYKMKIIFASPNYPLYFAVPIEPVGAVYQTFNEFEKEMFDSSNIVPIEGKEEELAKLIENDVTSNLTNKLERFDTRWEPNYRGMPMEPQGIDENIEFFIPVLKELEQVLWKYGIKMSITRDEILYNKVTLYLLAPPISSKSRKVAIRTFRISKRSPHLDLLREIKKIGIPISQKWLPKMNELEHIDMEMANNYYTKRLIDIGEERMEILKVLQTRDKKYRTKVSDFRGFSQNQRKIQDELEWLALTTTDHRDDTVLLIDAESTMSREQAMSVKKFDNGLRELCVHTVDMQMYYPIREDFTKHFSNTFVLTQKQKSLVSFQENRISPAITLKQHFDASGNMVGPSQCYFSVIEPRIALDNNEVVQILRERNPFVNFVTAAKMPINPQPKGEINEFQRLRLESVGVDYAEVEENYKMLADLLIDLKLPDMERVSFLNKNGLSIDHVKHSMNQFKQLELGKNIPMERNDILGINESMSLPLRLSDMLMYRFILENCDESEFDFLERMKVFSPVKKRVRMDGELELTQLFNASWTAPMRKPLDFYLHMVLRRIIHRQSRQKMKDRIRREKGTEKNEIDPHLLKILRKHLMSAQVSTNT